MRLLLINPSRGAFNGMPKEFRAGTRRMNRKSLAMPLALCVLAGLTPAGVDVSVIDEDVEPIDFKFEAVLIGITVLTCNAPRAYAIADEFRRNGRHVVLGGLHVTALPEEAARHADAIVVGEAEEVWEGGIEDFLSNKLKNIYKPARVFDMARASLPRRDIASGNAYSFHVVQTSRGCPFKCSICAATGLDNGLVRTAGSSMIKRDIEHIVAGSRTDVKVRDNSGRRYNGFVNLFIADDNFTINKWHALSVASIIEELSERHRIKIRWSAQCDISAADDERLLKSLSRSGCVRLFVGIESVDPAGRAFFKKRCHLREDCGAAVERIYLSGIDVVASFIIGGDNDRLDFAGRLVKFAAENKIYDLLVNVLTPYPGTEVFEELKREGRLLTKDWSRYDMAGVVFSPLNMTPAELSREHGVLLAKLSDKGDLCARLLRRGKDNRTRAGDLIFEDRQFMRAALIRLILKSSAILKSDGMRMTEVLKAAYCFAKHSFAIENGLSLQTVAGLEHYTDRLNYMQQKSNVKCVCL